MREIITDILIRDGESFDDYAIRLYSAKEAYNLTNAEIGELLNKESGNNWDESAYRKKYTTIIEGYNKGYERGLQDGLQVDDEQAVKYIDELREEKYQFWKAKKQVQDQNRELRKHLTVEARSEHLQQVMGDSIANLSDKKMLYVPENKLSDDKNKVAVLQISDWHYGEEVNQFNNKYNTQICRERVGRLTRDTINYCKKEDITTLKVLNLGDMISGNIRVSARVLNEEDVITQITEVTELISEMLSEFSKHFNVEFYSVLDNHSRVNANYSQHIEKESYARLISWHTMARFKGNPRVKVIENEIGGIEDYDIGVVDIFDERALFVHGHNDRIAKVIPDITLISGIKPIAIFMGHLHSNIEKEEYGIDLIVNPSLIGSGVYSKQIRKSSKPRQKLTIFEKDDKVKRLNTYFIEVE